MARKRPASSRNRLIEQVFQAGREWSRSAVMFHTAVAERMGLSASEIKTLDILEKDGPQTAGELKAQTGLAAPSITGILDRLERKGLIQRRRDIEDARRVVVELNRSEIEKAREMYAVLMKRMAKIVERYSEAELAAILSFMNETAKEQIEATEEITSADSSPSPTE